MTLTMRVQPMPADLVGVHAVPCEGEPVRLVFSETGHDVARVDAYLSDDELQVGYVHVAPEHRRRRISQIGGALLVEYAAGRLIRWSPRKHWRITAACEQLQQRHPEQRFA